MYCVHACACACVCVIAQRVLFALTSSCRTVHTDTANGREPLDKLGIVTAGANRRGGPVSTRAELVGTRLSFLTERSSCLLSRCRRKVNQGSSSCGSRNPHESASRWIYSLGGGGGHRRHEFMVSRRRPGKRQSDLGGPV